MQVQVQVQANTSADQEPGWQGASNGVVLWSRAGQGGGPTAVEGAVLRGTRCRCRGGGGGVVRPADDDGGGRVMLEGQAGPVPGAPTAGKGSACGVGVV